MKKVRFSKISEERKIYYKIWFRVQEFSDVISTWSRFMIHSNEHWHFFKMVVDRLSIQLECLTLCSSHLCLIYCLIYVSSSDRLSRYCCLVIFSVSFVSHKGFVRNEMFSIYLVRMFSSICLVKNVLCRTLDSFGGF